MRISSSPFTPPLAITGMSVRARQIDGRLDIAALEQPVAADVGEQQAGDARILEPAGQVDDEHVGHFGPALGRDHAVARVHRDDDAARKFARHVLDELAGP